MRFLNDARVELQLGLVGILVMIGLVATGLYVIIENAPFETKADAHTQAALQAQLNAQAAETLRSITATQLDLQSRISDLQDDEIQIQQWLMDNQTPTHPYVPRDHAEMRHHR